MARSGSSSSPDETFFNDLSQQTAVRRTSPQPECSNGDGIDGVGDNDSTPRAKRIACVLCRKRKLRCDGAKPKCGTCTRLSHDCGYDEVRKKSGPKRGYVKLLEARLQQVETLLKSQDPAEQNRASPDKGPDPVSVSSASEAAFGRASAASMPSFADEDTPMLAAPMGASPDNEYPFAAAPKPGDGAAESEPFPWEMIGLGLEEPLPTQDVVNELHQIYFDKVHASMPMIHRPRYLAAMNLAPNMRPPVCLRYSIWCMAASVSEKYSALTDHFYRRSRKYAEMDEMRGHGEAIITIAHCQTWVLLSLFDFKNMNFPRAWQGTHRAASLALMMGLNRLDGAGLDVKQCLPPPRDWTEREERRRTYWMCFCADRYASIGTGWPMTIDESDIMTLLPSSEESYNKSKPTISPSLEQAFKQSAVAYVSPFSGVILIACLLGRNLTHLHRPTPHDNEEDLNGAFWQRHRQLESILANITLALPDHLRLPAGLPDPNVIFMNMLLHTSVICLHQAAIFKADKNRLPQHVIAESRARCVTGAAEITRIMRMMSHLDLSTLNPFLAFCLYVAGRVFVQYLKWRPKDQNMISSLQFLASAMQALKRKNPLTESFLAQLEIDLEGTGVDIGTRSTLLARGAFQIPVNSDSVQCSPLFEIRESQNNSGNASAFNNKSYMSGTPGMNSASGFATMNAQVNLDIDGSYNNISAHDSVNYQLPSRAKMPTTLFDSVSRSSDMDCSNSSDKTRSNSYKDSSSHNSFTPPSQNDDIQSQYQSNLAKNSPGTADSGSGITTPSVSAPDSMYFGVADSNFSSFQQSQLFMFGPSSPLQMGPGWEMGGGDATSGTGMTPIPDASWNDILSGAQDWATFPSPGFDRTGRQSHP